MEQHLATDHEGEFDKNSPADEQAPAEIAPAPLETPQTASTGTAEASAHVAVDTASHELSPMTTNEDAEPAALPDAIAAAPPPESEPAEPAAAFTSSQDVESESPQTPAPIELSPVIEHKPVEPVPAAPASSSAAFLEQWQQNEHMRHVPPIAWIVSKVDDDVRKRLEMFLSVYENVASADPRRRNAEESLFAVCRSLDRLAEAARRTRSVLHPPNEIAFRIPWSVNTAVTVLKNTDASTFGRRQPCQSFERSGAESVYASLTVVLQRIDAAAAILREIDPTIDEKLYGPLVRLVEPLPTAPMA